MRYIDIEVITRNSSFNMSKWVPRFQDCKGPGREYFKESLVCLVKEMNSGTLWCFLLFP